MILPLTIILVLLSSKTFLPNPDALSHEPAAALATCLPPYPQARPIIADPAVSDPIQQVSDNKKGVLI
jgi:hypothetical protein